MECKVRFTGFEAMSSHLKKLESEMETKLRAAFNAGLMDWRRAAAKRIPVATGRDRASLRYGIERTARGFRGVLGTDSKSALYTEFGTRRHFIKPTRSKVLSWQAADGSRAFSRGHFVSGIRVGTPATPRRTWPAKQATGTATGKSGQNESMPWLRSSWRDVEDKIIERLKKVLG